MSIANHDMAFMINRRAVDRATFSLNGENLRNYQVDEHELLVQLSTQLETAKIGSVLTWDYIRKQDNVLSTGKLVYVKQPDANWLEVDAVHWTYRL